MGDGARSGAFGNGSSRGLDLSSLERARVPRAPRGPASLEACPACDSALVHPLEWEPRPGQRWHAVLRCPECEWRGQGVFTQAEVDRYDEILDDGTTAMLELLRELARANLEDEIDRFTAALAADLILPEDF